MVLSTLGPHVSSSLLFFGPPKKPFLAPRGVWVVKNKLFVADTGQNRVFIWHRIPTREYVEPDVVLGQESGSSVARNGGGVANASTLHYPSGLWSDGRQLIVADAWNHRVLIWNRLPKTSGQPADVVLGQADFAGCAPNRYGPGNSPDTCSLNWPYGVYADGKSLWIADTGNRRILYYSRIPKESFASADRVIGKPHFSTRDWTQRQAVWPYSVKIGPAGQLAIADTQYYRVLLWMDKDRAFEHPADVIIGQPDFDGAGANQYLPQPAAHTLSWTYDTCFYRNGLLVADTGNSRILWFDRLPNQSNQAATSLIGRPDFSTGSEYRENLMGTQSALYWPFSLAIANDTLYIADTGNHRIVIARLQCQI